jgi:hypothetical protein
MFRVRRRTAWFAREVVLFAAVSGALPSCIETPPRSAFAIGSGVGPAAHVLALSTYEASLGTVIDAHGTRFPPAEKAETKLHFRGTFAADDGVVEAVDFETEAHALDPSTVRWSTFGPYGDPFSSKPAALGTFEGTVGARVYDAAGTMRDDEDPIAIDFTVKPSIVVHELEPISASCSGPVKRLLGGGAYRVRVEAIGFEPVSYTYTLAAPALSSPPFAVRHLADGRFDVAGERGDFIVPPVPEGEEAYDLIVTVEARDAAARAHVTSFAIAVHRPLELFYDGAVDLAEILAPVPVSGCIPGGESGRTVQYSEAMQETRMKSFNVSWNESWLMAHTVSQGTESTIGATETNGVGFATTDETSWNWSLGNEVSGRVSIEKLVEVGISASTSMGGGGSHAMESSASRDKSLNNAETTTDTREASSENGGQQGGGFSWEASSEKSISRDFGGEIIAGTYGVFYRQTLRLVRRGSIVTYNQCGAATVVGNVDFSDWAWSPDLALGGSCPPLPASNLPAAKCLVPPCAGD